MTLDIRPYTGYQKRPDIRYNPLVLNSVSDPDPFHFGLPDKVTKKQT